MEQRMKSSIEGETLPLVSVVILSWNRKKELIQTLIELRKQTYPNLEIIVVDNNSSDGTCELIENSFSEVKLIKLPKNIGVEGYNVGFKNAKGKYILVLDDDSYPTEDSISNGVRKLEKDLTLGIIAFKIISPNGEIITKYWPEEVSSFWGCGAMMRKDALEKVGYYDGDFFLYSNEIDLAIRFLNCNYRIVYDKNSTAIHCMSFSKYRMKNKGMFYATRNHIWFCFKYLRGNFLIIGLIRTIFTLLFRSLRYKCIYGFISGIFLAFFYINKALQKRVKVSNKIVNYYFANHDMFEPIVKKMLRWYRKKSFEEVYFLNT